VKWPFNCQRYKRTTADPKMTFYGRTIEDKDDSGWVTDKDSVMSDDGESDE